MKGNADPKPNFRHVWVKPLTVFWYRLQLMLINAELRIFYPLMQVAVVSRYDASVFQGLKNVVSAAHP